LRGFSPSPPPLWPQTSLTARAIKIWRPDGTSGPCHYLNGAKLRPLKDDPGIINFASFDPEGSELAIVGYTPPEGKAPGDVLLSSVHPEYIAPGACATTNPLLQMLCEELSSKEAKEFNEDIWKTIRSYFNPVT
jgi:hypothetical protein